MNRCLIVLFDLVFKLHNYLTLCFLIGISYAPYATKVFCSQTISKRSIYTQLPYVQTTIESVYAYAKALRTAQRNRCGDSFNGVCDSLRSMPTSEFHNILKNTDFTVSACKRSSKNILKGALLYFKFNLYEKNHVYQTQSCFKFHYSSLHLMVFRVYRDKESDSMQTVTSLIKILQFTTTTTDCRTQILSLRRYESSLFSLYFSH